MRCARVGSRFKGAAPFTVRTNGHAPGGPGLTRPPTSSGSGVCEEDADPGARPGEVIRILTLRLDDDGADLAAGLDGLVCRRGLGKREACRHREDAPWGGGPRGD